MNTNQKVQSTLPLIKEVIKNLELYFNKNNEYKNKNSLLELNDTYGITIDYECSQVQSYFNLDFVLDFVQLNLFKKDHDTKISENIFSLGIVFKTVRNSNFISNKTVWFQLNSNLYKTSVYEINIPCTEEEYFMYTLKDEYALELTVYEEADSLRKEINELVESSNDIYTIISKIAGAGSCIGGNIKAVYISFYNEETGLADLNEIHKCLRNRV